MDSSERIPASVAELTQPPPLPTPGVALRWQFHGGEYAIVVEPAAVVESSAGWTIRTEGKTVQIMRAHVQVFESRPMLIKPRQKDKDR